VTPEDQTPNDDPGRDQDADAGEHEVPPSTWAARKRSGGEEPEEAGSADAAPGEKDSGLTDDFDAIERELDAELEGLGQIEDEEEADEAAEDEAAADEDAADEDAEDAMPEAEPEADAEAEPEPDGEPATEAADVESSAEAADATAPDPSAASGETVEVDTLATADREAAQEAALAGLKARAGGKHWDRGAAEVAAAPGPGGAGEPARAQPIWPRFLAASLVIITTMAAATSVSAIVEFDYWGERLGHNDRLAKLGDRLTEVEGGDPQTILIVGSDERLNMPGDRRSDTTILLRVDPDQQVISLLSIPRDLKVNIPNHGIDKFNAAYSYGGEKLTLRVAQQLTGVDIHHLVNINFTGFAEAVNAIDCVYADVDRRYYIPPESGTAEIDVEAGYQRLCGLKALQYVRFRHFDNDLVRSARQQDFLREARHQVPPWKLFQDRDELLTIFTDYTTSDISDGSELWALLKTFIEARSAELREVHFPADLGEADNTGYVTASNEAIKQTVATFLGAEGSPGPPEAGESEAPADQGPDAEEKPKPGKGGKDKPEPEPEGPAMDDATAQGQQSANQLSKVKTKGGDPMATFPIFYPTRLVPGSIIARDSRAFPIDGPGSEKYRGYKMVVQVPGSSFGNGLVTEYYGISGTNWEDPPILDNPSESRNIDGRTYDLYYDSDRLRLVAWHEKRGSSYWVINTLSQSLSEAQMLEIAVSMRQLDR
jgi:LCP family protein required for cell wall assembly